MSSMFQKKNYPRGATSTDDVMAVDGVWIAGSQAVEMLSGLIKHISDNKIKFGIFTNDVEEVVNEFSASLI